MSNTRVSPLVPNTKPNVLANSLYGLAVAEQIENKHLAPFGEIGSDPVPDVRRERRAMGKDDRRSVAEHVVAHRLPAKRVSPPEGPGDHVRFTQRPLRRIWPLQPAAPMSKAKVTLVG